MLKFGALAILAWGGAALAASMPTPSCNLVPGWTQEGPARTFEGENLFEYMDGNSEGYLIYGFKVMRGVTCKKGEITFVVDVSDMGDADSAYGIFTANRDARVSAGKVGMGSQIVPRRAMFSKGQYYLEIAANPEGDHTAALTEWIAALDKITAGRTTPPDALDWFPQDKLTSVRLVPESVLGIRILKKGYLAQYEFGKAFVITEASPESAKGVMEKLRARFGGTTAVKIGDEAFQLNDKYLGRLCFFRKGHYLGGYANVAEGQDPVALAAALAGKL